MSIILLLSLLLNRYVIGSSLIERNTVIGRPNVECGINNIIVHLHTSSVFKGRLYVEGESSIEGCSKSYDSDNLSFDLSLGTCNMRRQRTLQPRGVSFSFTLIVSFHPLFVTGMDKAFNIKCFFLESIKNLHADVGVGSLTTELIEEDYALPQCIYQLRNGHDGDILRYAQVGQKVTHSWTCQQDSGRVYGILIHSCYADDGQGNKFQLVDDTGCALDEWLLPQISYNSHSISASTDAYVFKYADKVQLLFTCTIQLCYKHDGGCEGITPPICSSSSNSISQPSSLSILPHDSSNIPIPPHSPPIPPPSFTPQAIPFIGIPPSHIPTIPSPNQNIPTNGRFNEEIGIRPNQKERQNQRQLYKNIGRPYRDSPLNETEIDEIDILEEEEKMNTDGTTVSYTKTTFDNKSTTKLRREAEKKMETDVTIDVIVLPVKEKEKKVGPIRALPFVPFSSDICISRVNAVLLSLLCLICVAIFSSITYIIALKTKMIYRRKDNLCEAYR